MPCKNLSTTHCKKPGSRPKCEALTLHQSGKYRALVTDVGLNGNMTGWEGARQFREREPALPVIYMTGAAADEWASQGGPGSILLAKPFAPAQLVTAVSQLINAAGPPSDAAQ